MSGHGTDLTSDLLDELVRVSREIGGDPRLVLHGGGNTSLKTMRRDITGRPEAVLHIKGSGHDLATIGSDGFAPLLLERVRRLLPPTHLDDLTLQNELRCAVLRADAPDPSVETLVHALVPHACVLHSHADAILALTNTADGRERVASVYGNRVVIVGYEMPGQDLAAACQQAWADQAHSGTEGIVVLHHGLFAVGDSPQQALDHHASLIDAAMRHLETHESPTAPGTSPGAADEAVNTVATTGTATADQATAAALAVARLRSRLCALAGAPVIVRRSTDSAVRAFLDDPGLLSAADRGPLTPDHVIWTKRVPMIGGDLDAYVDEYRAYFAAHEHRRGVELTALDPAPRIVLDTSLGMLAVGRTAREARVAEDIYRHTLDTIARAERLGGYQALPPEHVFDLEYWSLQQDKLRRAAPRGSLVGRVAVVTGAASGIGRACAHELLMAGATVVGWDISASVVDTFDSPEWLGLQVDVTDPDAISHALGAGVDAFGGLDILVVAAGIFPTSQPITEMPLSTWRRTMAVNVDSVASLYGQAQPFLALAPGGGRVVLVASKNVAAPGPGASAYSASKAAVTQLSRVAALEWAPDGIRVNMVHPDAVFDTGLWTPELLAARAEHYGMSVTDYKRRNLLRTEVTSAAVGRLVRAMADDTFACTTGAQVPIDGGNERVI